MARTIRDIPVQERTVQETMGHIVAWAQANNHEVVESTWDFS